MSENYFPLVSVIIALYNGEKYIEQSINSIRDQSYKNLEIVVVNDGSTDNSPVIVETLAKQDKRILLFHQSNKGQCAASNFGFSKATGKYVKFFDSDDILTLGVIESQVKSLQGKGEFEGAYIDYIRFYDDDISTVNKFPRHELIKKDCTPIEYITFTGTPPMYNNAIWLFPRKIFEITGLWDERLSVNNDGEFFPRVLKSVKRLYYTAGEMVYYRTISNGNSLSQKISKRGVESALLSVDLMAVHLRSILQSTTIEKIIAQSYSQVLGMSYPAFPEITRDIEKKLAAFDKSDYSIANAGKLYNFFEKLFGWKAAKRLQIIYYKYKYKKSGS